MLGINDINLLHAQNEGYRKQNEDLQKENKHLKDLYNQALKDYEEALDLSKQKSWEIGNLGYKIPDSYDEKIKDLPQAYARQLRDAYNGLGHQNNPFDTMFSGFIDIVEDQSGLDMENILFNSIDILSTD